jgi:hypothetical protein
MSAGQQIHPDSIFCAAVCTSWVCSDSRSDENGTKPARRRIHPCIVPLLWTEIRREMTDGKKGHEICINTCTSRPDIVTVAPAGAVVVVAESRMISLEWSSWLMQSRESSESRAEYPRGSARAGRDARDRSVLPPRPHRRCERCVEKAESVVKEYSRRSVVARLFCCYLLGRRGKWQVRGTASH